MQRKQIKNSVPLVPSVPSVPLFVDCYMVSTKRGTEGTEGTKGTEFLNCFLCISDPREQNYIFSKIFLIRNFL